MAKRARKLILTHKRAPGDVVAMTALVRDLVTSFPGKFEVDVDTSAMDLWRNNPYLTPLREKQKRVVSRDVEYIKCQYGRGIRDQNYEPVHFLAYWHRDFERQTKIKVPVTAPYPDLHLSEEERTVPIVEGRYWVVLSGGKSDFTAKVWEVRRMQQVVERLGEMGLGVVQIGSNDTGHWHPPLQGENVINLVAQTNLRDMMRLIHHADGVICGITCAMHMAAALHRPCVVLGGGREAWWWEAYVRQNKGLVCPEKLKVPHQFLHTIGLLDCCKHHGCWKNKVVPLRNDKSLCYHPVVKPGQPVPLCMDMITVEHVMEAVMKYYTDQTLPPVSADKQQQPQAPPPQAQVVQAQPPTAPPAAPPAAPPPREPKKDGLLNLFDLPASPPPTDAPAQPPAPARGRKTTKVKAQTRVEVPEGMTPEEFMRKAKFRVNPKAKMETRGDGRSTEVAAQPGAPSPQAVAPGNDVFDHPDIGGRFTICALLYGPEKFFDLHQRCLSSIVATTPPERVDLRVGANALNPKSMKMLRDYQQQGIVSKIYEHPENAYKYPVMREMFHDRANPIDTKWVLWFDDDSIADRTPAWLNLLAQHIIQFHRRDNAHMFGAPFVWTLKPGQREWYESRPWHRGKQWRLHNGKPSPSGNKIVFCTGGFWAITKEAIDKCDIPDIDIGHNGGDVTIGEQLYQGGFRQKAWNAKKQFIHTSSVPRRGDTLPMPGTAGHQSPRVVRVQ